MLFKNFPLENLKVAEDKIKNKHHSSLAQFGNPLRQSAIIIKIGN